MVSETIRDVAYLAMFNTHIVRYIIFNSYVLFRGINTELYNMRESHYYRILRNSEEQNTTYKIRTLNAQSSFIRVRWVYN